MVTALAATYQAGTGVAPPAVLLQVTGAPGKPVSAYASNFSATLDSWVGAGAGFTLTRDTGRVPIAMKLTGTGNSATPVTAKRTVTGLSIGTQYRFRGFVQTIAGSFVALGVTGQGFSAYLSVPARAYVDFVFTATAASHELVVQARAPHAAPVTVWADTLTVDPVSAWLGTKIVRTDVNGIALVRLDPGQDIPNGSSTLTVKDYEAALTGVVSYTVTDGLGATATAAPVTPATPGVWLTLPATAVPTTTPPQFAQLTMITDLDETADSNGSLHVVIGRSDPLANPGPMTLRAGTLTLFVDTYTQARALRLLLKSGEIALLRQPTFPGMDLYFTARRITIAPDPAETSPRHWTVTMTYAEVLAP
jgi:hypothetical protein